MESILRDLYTDKTPQTKKGVFKGGPEPSEKLIRKVLVPTGSFHFYFIPVPKQIQPYHPTWYISRTG